MTTRHRSGRRQKRVPGFRMQSTRPVAAPPRSQSCREPFASATSSARALPAPPPLARSLSARSDMLPRGCTYGLARARRRTVVRGRKHACFGARGRRAPVSLAGARRQHPADAALLQGWRRRLRDGRCCRSEARSRTSIPWPCAAAVQRSAIPAEVFAVELPLTSPASSKRASPRIVSRGKLSARAALLPSAGRRRSGLCAASITIAAT
jgi:hypothetical protein